jgi:hypothetical protein
VPGVACKNKQKSCGEMNRFPEMDIVESCSERKKSCTQSLETQPEHVPRVKSSQIYIAYPRIVNSLLSFYLSAFNSFPAIFFFLDQAAQILWSNKGVEKAMPSLSGADAQLPHSARKKCPREMPSTRCLCPLDPPTVP